MLPTPQLVVMGKRPALGAVKTRLARGIGTVAAARFYRRTSLELLARVAVDPRWQTVLALTPDRAVHDEGVWPRAVPRIAQGLGDLGARMGRLMRDLPPGPVVIIGSDIPDISRGHIAEAFTALGNADAVFGPSEDGGYWLVGLRRRPRIVDIFGSVRWSSEYALADTLRNVEAAGLSVARLQTLRDIDTGEDYARWRQER
ncbi:MAG: TIGR04282 family arsenosugar biosynthesis glycosyltransferase [Parvibaculum sp.]|uniref:TIGR04282 family arsenosugar biosynthesis glycosyltransferase n=1 Tax=Parvibaculum sp. TaxID=2024848 RepID=UPI0025E1ACD7|nr:TIGR04282 family arsenosugar biosynthesis glycosyltransferase [Parvibaculum sp.]MCE9649961.1 TIGR04282 family arsenosugar biosynthesis glycosyltransferase [Parvibaculum sp.]